MEDGYQHIKLGDKTPPSVLQSLMPFSLRRLSPSLYHEAKTSESVAALAPYITIQAQRAATGRDVGGRLVGARV